MSIITYKHVLHVYKLMLIQIQCIFLYLMQCVHKIHINVLPVSGSHPMAKRIHAAVPPAPPGGGPAAKFWPLKGTAPPPEMEVLRGNLGNMMGTYSNGICRGTSMIPGLIWKRRYNPQKYQESWFCWCYLGIWPSGTKGISDMMRILWDMSGKQEGLVWFKHDAMKILLGINEILMGYTTKNNLAVLLFNTREGGPQGIQTWERLMPKRDKFRI